MQRKATPDFDAVYREHADRVFRYCRILCRNNDTEAQDVAQETFIRAYRSLEQFEGRSSMLTWLLTIARREWIRRGSREREAIALEETELADPAGDPAVQETHRIWLQEALARLPAQLREAVLLVKVEGLTHREAAEVLELPQGTVQFHVSQGLKQLRKLLVEERGITGLAAVLVVFLLPREMQAAVTAPAGLGERIYTGIGREYPPTGSLAPGLRNTPSGGGSAAWRHVALGVIGGSLVLLTGMLAWKRGGGSFLQPDPLQRVLGAMSQVKTAHAVAIYRDWNRRLDGTLQLKEHTSEFWFKRPRNYRQTSVDETGRQIDLIVSNGKATRRSNDHDDVIRKYVWDPIPEQLLSPFAYFTPDGMLARLAREGRPRVTTVRTKLGNRVVQRVTVEGKRSVYLYRWILDVDPNSQRVLRVEITGTPEVNPDARPPGTVTLERIDYDVAVPDDLFRVDQ